MDLSQRGQVSSYQLYTNIFDRFKISYSNAGMKSYVIQAPDFKPFFEILETQGEFLATPKNGDTQSTIEQEKQENGEERSKETTCREQWLRERARKRSLDRRKKRKRKRHQQSIHQD